MVCCVSRCIQPSYKRYTVTSKIYEVRKQNNWTLKQLSELSGVPFNTIWRMENGYGTALRNAYKVANVLQTTIYALWDIPTSAVSLEVPGRSLSVSDLRSRRGWNLDELARLSGVSKTTIFHLEKGHTPTLENAVKIATALGVSVYQIWKP
jgi:transcriptional regulator with XRE-family HTH domain